MKRRQLLRYAQSSLLATLGLGTAAGWQRYQAQNQPAVTIQWLGHTCFLFSGNGQRILVNPFRPIGCTAGYGTPNVEADLVLISSRLLDEGSVEVLPGNPRILFEAGVYQLTPIKLQGLAMDHDRLGGRRFGRNVAWKWSQGGVTIVHLGGAASPIALEQRILIGRPDILILPVGGGPKAYGPQEAKQALQALNPKLVIPSHYRTAAADPQACDLGDLEAFLAAMGPEAAVRRSDSSTMTLGPQNLPETGSVIQVLAMPSKA